MVYMMHEAQEQHSSSASQLSPALRERIHTMVVRTRPHWAALWDEDFVQLAMIRIARALERKSQPARIPAAYVRRVAYTATLDEVRRLAVRPRLATTPAAADEAIHAEELDPSRSVEARQTVDAIQSCLSSLLPTRRKAVVLYLEGHTVPEAAERLGWSIKRTENLVYRGLADLRRALSMRGFGP